MARISVKTELKNHVILAIRSVASSRCTKLSYPAVPCPEPAVALAIRHPPSSK